MTLIYYSKKIFSIALLVGLSSIAFAQYKISSQIIDQNGNPIPFASIQLKQDSSSKKLIKGAISDIEGSFLLKDIPVGLYILEVTNMGYQPYSKSIVLEKDVDVNLKKVVLNTDLFGLNEVVITSKKKLIEQKPDKIIMNIEQSILAAGNDLYNILAMAPALQVINGTIFMQGKTGVLVILDGKKLPGTTLENVLSAIPGDQINRIEIITNPSSKYDADASGGVIEIYTKRNKALGWSASIGGNGSMGEKAAGGMNAGFRLNTKRIDFNIDGSYSERTKIEQGSQSRFLYDSTDKVGELTQRIDFTDNSIKNNTFNTGFNYQIDDRNTIGAEFGFTKVSYDGIGDVNSQINDLDEILLTSSRNKIKWGIDLFNYNLKYKTELDSLGSNLTFLGSYANYKNDKTQFFDQTQSYGNSNREFRSQILNITPADFDIYTFSGDFTKVWAKGMKLEAGLKYTHTSNESSQFKEELSNGNQVTNNLSLAYKEEIIASYANLNLNFGDKLSMQLGIRAENTSYTIRDASDDNYFKLFPNVRFDYEVNENLTSSVGYSKNINRPGYEMLIPFEMLIDNYTVRKGNALLEPEYAHNFFFNQIFKSASLRFAYTITDDAISDLYLYDANSQHYVATQNNFLKSHLFSSSLFVPVQVQQWWDSNIAVNGFYKNLNFPSVLNPNIINSKSKYYYTFNTFNSFDLGKNWSSELNFYYYSAFFDGLYDFSDFSNLSFGIKKSMFKNKAFLKFDVSDVLYKSNIKVSTNELPAISNSLLEMDTRRVRVSFRYNISGKSKVKSKPIKERGNEIELDRLGI